MTTSKTNVKLLAPAGSMDCITAAINAGADAIYFGVEQLNMRTRSSGGFSVGDIQEVVRICHASGVKAYLTLNTVMYDHDLRLLQLILKEAGDQGIDAVIAADVSVFQQCMTFGIPVHVSTQANISNLAAVEFYARFSDLVVLARELTLQQIAHITAEIKRKDIRGISGEPMQVEIFVHGALCMAISGKCYLSLHSQWASANRGACVQNCRRPYKVADAETGEELLIDNEYIMSPKDLCTIGVLDQILETGVDVLKIEGRSKGADYVFETTRCYKEAIMAIEEGSYTPTKIADWLKRLDTVYNRGFWEGYYAGHATGEWTSTPGSIATEKKTYVAKGVKYYGKIGVGEFDIETGSLEQGDTVMLIGNAHGMVKMKLEPLMVNGQPSEKAKKGDKITIPVATKVAPGDKLYKITEANA